MVMTTWEQDKTKLTKNGKWKEFNKHAVLIADGLYLNGKKHGTWREYYDATGTLMIEENYKQGIQHGPYTSFYPNGQVCSEGQFSHGLREGFFKVYDEQGNNTRNLLFVNNIQIETATNAYPLTKEQGKEEPGADYISISIILLFWIIPVLQASF